MDFLTNINLHKNQLLNPVIHNAAFPPLNPEEGQLYFDTQEHKLYVHNGSGWVLAGSIVATGAISDGNIPIWSGTGGDKLAPGYAVETSLTGTANTIATSNAIFTYLQSFLATNDAMVYKGVKDGSTNPLFPVANAGDTYKISGAGKIGGENGVPVEVGDMIICTTDGAEEGTAAEVGHKWNVIQANIDGAVVGTNSSTAGNIPIYTNENGRSIQDSGYKISDFSLDGHTHNNIPQKIVKLLSDDVVQIITHNLNSRDLIITIRETDSPFSAVYTDVEFTSANTLTVKFAKAPFDEEYTITIVG